MKEEWMYKLIFWPFSQEYMDEPWFEEEAILAPVDAVDESQAYFIPWERVLDHHKTSLVES